MVDLFEYEAEQEAVEPQLFSVTEISNALRLTVENTFGRVSVEGEVSSFRQPASGHLYFNLKDEESVLKSIVWRSTAGRLKTMPEEGMQVIAHGKMTTYGARSEYQIVIDRIEPAGLGALLQQLEERKKKLAEEGLFDEYRKRKLPFLPNKIGIVTSPTGAVIDDMLHRIEDRCPRHILLAPVLVQGTGAAEQITAAIKAFNAMKEKPDVIIVARGGGSLEDLWAFNEEMVVRAIADSEIPVVSGVGHEPDVTLADYVADVRAPTPSAAAEMVVPVRDDLIYTLELHKGRLAQALQRMVTQPKMKLEDQRERMALAMKTYFGRLNEKVLSAQSLLKSYAPEGPLKRGYSMVLDDQGQSVNSVKTKAKDIKIRFHDGEREAALK